MRLSINPCQPDPATIARVVGILQSDGVIIYPTDTIYGIGCRLGSAAAIRRVYKIKGRREYKPLSFICADIGQVVSDTIYRLAKQLLPGPYTLILPATPNCPKVIQSSHRAVGIRIPNHPVTNALVQVLGEPLITTSANISGSAPMSDPTQLEKQFGQLVDYILDVGIITGESSTILDCTGQDITLVRLGAGSWPPV